MAHDLNRCEFIGRLGKDPEVRFIPSGDAIANLSIAVGKSYTDKAGEKREETTWVPLTMFGKLAEIAGEYLKKGAQVYVAGEFHVRKYQAKDGTDRWATEVRVDKMQMLGSKSDAKPEGDKPAPSKSASDYAAAKGGTTKRAAPAKAGGFDDLEDDIPFASCDWADDPIFRKLRWLAS